MIAVIDYGVGNLFSVEKALLQFADDVVVTGDEKLILAADKLVLPGVGDFGECMSNLEYLNANAPSMVSPILCTELEENQSIRLIADGAVKAGEPVFVLAVGFVQD